MLKSKLSADRKKEIVDICFALIHLWLDHPDKTLKEIIKMYEKTLLNNNLHSHNIPNDLVT